jgi:hypothetical protein
MVLYHTTICNVRGFLVLTWLKSNFMCCNVTDHGVWACFKMWFKRLQRPAICLCSIRLGIEPFLLLARGRMEDLMCPGARRLGAGAPITVLQFAPLAVAPGAGFSRLFIACVPGSMDKGAFCRTRDNKLEGRKWQEAYLLHLLAD